MSSIKVSKRAGTNRTSKKVKVSATRQKSKRPSGKSPKAAPQVRRKAKAQPRRVAGPSVKTSALRERMHEDLKLAGYADRTQECYVRAVRQLAEHYHQSPDALTDQQIRDLLRGSVGPGAVYCCSSEMPPCGG